MAPEDNKSNVPSILGQPPCLQFERWGTCAYGDNCRYAHIAGSTYEQRNVGKMVPCKFFSSDKGCPFGNACRFLHQEVEERRESSVIRIVTSGNEVDNKRAVDVRSKKYLKTQLCTMWEKNGSCSYGATCQFAHGISELQSLGSSNPQESRSTAGISAPAKNVASNNIGFTPPSEPPRSIYKWADLKKNSQIYGDWIEPFS
ncbi:zinc finger CCCH domain-containing protein 56-like [Lycium barbarum]|uniref:zinc finger CCCH domain-containing protein 56-like n=1 Tax=Lycium barbarum TaxID=112863 RepID=UPI00293E38B3|nr:zinc finger CCCH domain-containing protein 56-like [Lycium barbarum]